MEQRPTSRADLALDSTLDLNRSITSFAPMKFELTKTARGLSDADLLADMRRVALELGRETVTFSEYAQHGQGHSSTIQRRFGSWFLALEKAGLQPSRSAIGITDDALYENLRTIWMILGRQPRYSEIKKPASQYSAGTYENRFGSWSRALELFVEWVNGDEIDEPKAPQNLALPTREIASNPKRTKREVSDRMRFRILVRDGFVCRTCGASPLKNPGTELHVDHLVPWSKGGETIEENLATKCAQCNLGKGNAFEV